MSINDDELDISRIPALEAWKYFPMLMKINLFLPLPFGRASLAYPYAREVGV
jgi:hypothetical protein